MAISIESPKRCPACDGEITFGYGLAAGGPEPRGYYMCLDCDWMGPRAQQTVCFPHGIVTEVDES
jgi:hypothetical protein